MSTSTASSPKKKMGKANAAKWDEVTTQTLLHIFEEEIQDGNRPLGIFSKTIWKNIVVKFKMRKNLDYTKDQLKNRQDNLRREYMKWEKLINKEMGLGWDTEKKTLSAPDSWWLEKAKEDPTILKYRDWGPLWLDLMEKVFRGTTANGFHAYIPKENSHDPLLSQGDRVQQIDEIIDFTIDPTPVADDQFSPHNVATYSPTPSAPINARNCGKKCKRNSDIGLLTEGDKFSQGMDSFAQSMRDNMTIFNNCRPIDDAETISYKDAISLLKSVPGICPKDPHFMKGVMILEDKIRRIAFVEILELGIECVMAWIDTFP